jgi:hypothetical protein
MIRSTLNRSMLAIAIFATAGCGEETITGLTMLRVAGVYTATSLTTVTSGTTTNRLASGSTLNMVLAANGTVSGTFFAPAEGSAPAVSESMAGTWTLDGTTVDFTQSADTFVRDMIFTANGTTLVGDQTFGNTRVQVTLTRQ